VHKLLAAYVRRSKKLKLELDRLRSLPNRVGPSQAEVLINDQLIEMYHREEIMWRHRSRVEWLSKGDKKSKKIHQRACMRRRKNLIKSLTRSDGQVTEDPDEMKGMTTSFYKDLYMTEGVHEMNLVLDHVPWRVTPHMNDILTAEFTSEEVKKALFQMFPTKAPGPDGFPMHFFQRHWNVCGDDTTRAVLSIVQGTKSAEEINDTILVLIPKVKNPTLLTQFRPISLCNVFYKIASKVLANRLKLILLDIISEEQSAFVSGRLITDNIISAYECLQFMKKKQIKEE
jgi:hypothetical protein